LVGEILAGIAVGPHGLNIAPKPDALMMVGEFGLVLMVLEAGVEVDLASLSLVGARGVQVAFFGSLVPLAIGAVLSKLVFDMSAKTCLAVGASLAPTSMGISLKVLQDGGVLGTPTGQLIIAAAVMDDVIALVLLSELEALKDPTPVNFIVPIVSSLCFIVFVGYLATRVVPDVLVKQLVPRVPKKHLEGVLLGMVFVVAYGMMVTTHYGRSSHLLGAFLGGLCFCSLSSMQTVWHQQVEKILSWLIRVFFACTIGFEVPIRDLWTAPVLTRAAVFMIAAFGKVATGLFARPLTAVEASKIGFAMSAWGEFAFIVATASREAGTLGHQEFSAVILCVLLSAVYAPLCVSQAIKAEKRGAGLGKDGKRSLALVNSGERKWWCCGPKMMRREISFTTAAMPDGNKRAIYRVYYVCAIECPSRWGLNDAVLRAVYNPLVDLDVLDVSLESRGNDVMACELFLKDPSLQAPLDAEIECEENAAVNAKIVKIKEALEKLVLHRAPPRDGERVGEYEGEVLLARWVPDIQEPPPDSEASSTVGGDTWRNGAENGGFDESFVLKQAQTLLRGREEDVDVELGDANHAPGGGADGVDSGASSGPSSAGASPRPSATVVRRRRPPARRAIDALRAHKNRPFYRTASLANLLDAGERLQDDRDEELHARMVEARMETGEARAMAAARSGGHGMGAVKRTRSVQHAVRHPADVTGRRVSAGEWSLLERINEDHHPERDRHVVLRRSIDGDGNSLIRRSIDGSEGYPSANTTMTADVARGLAAEIALQDVMLSSQTLSGAGGRALATELRHAIAARSPPRSPQRRMSMGDRNIRLADASQPWREGGGGDDDGDDGIGDGIGGSDGSTPVTSLTGAHARQLAAQLKEQLRAAEAMDPAERSAALARSASSPPRSPPRRR
tara:strand:+ start:1518 stop:4235 length:2718 start_codon:yes stop_codon:yes gene_type:complete